MERSGCHRLKIGRSRSRHCSGGRSRGLDASAVIVTCVGLWRNIVVTMAHMNAAGPVNQRDGRLTESETTAPKPTSAAFMNHRERCSPAASRKVARPTSIVWRLPRARTLAAPRSLCGMPSVRTKSLPVPRGMMPRAAREPELRMPLATSLMVPSPPMATIVS